MGSDRLHGNEFRQFLAVRINNAGQVVGATTDLNGVQQAVLFSNGTLTNLGNLGEESSYATGISDNGQVVGYAYTPSGPSRAFVYGNGKMTDLNTLIRPSLGLTLNDAAAINNNGLIVGICTAGGETIMSLRTATAR